MALSNIFNEPRREITETAVGITVVVGIVAVDYVLTKFVEKSVRSSPADTSVFIAMMGISLAIMIMVGAVIAIASIIIHAIGECVCNMLERRGINLRPRHRSQQVFTGEAKMNDPTYIRSKDTETAV